MPNLAAANSLFDIYKSANPTPTPQIILPTAAPILEEQTSIISEENSHEAAPEIKAIIENLKQKWRLTTNHCSAYENDAAQEYCSDSQWKMQLELFERKKILDLQKNWRLSKEYCESRSSFRNYTFCQTLLLQQNKFCAQQKTNGRRIIIDLSKQVMYGLKDCELVVHTRITSGKNSTPTPAGEYKIYQQRGAHWMQGEWFVNMAFYFYGDYAIHDAGWRKSPYWSPNKRAVYGSHGCINTPSEAMTNIWEQFAVGDTVQVYRSLPQDIANEINQKVGTRLPHDPEDIVALRGR